MKRRGFIFGIAMLPLATAPFAAALPAVTAQDEYDEFTHRVWERVTEIVRREGRDVHRMWIDPPRAEGIVYVRTVHIMLEAGGSLLDKLHFEFEEVSGSRLAEF